MMKKVVVNIPFKDRYTGKLLKADGKVLEMTEDRVKEVKEVNPDFITVVGNVEAPQVPEVPETPETPEIPEVPEAEGDKADDKKAKAKAKK